MEVGLNDDEMNEAKKASNGAVAIDVPTDVGGSRNSESSKAEKVCRICHLSRHDSSSGRGSGGGSSELISLGCECRGELGVSHSSCAEAWFSQKRNRLCEICGKTAENIVININSSFRMEWSEMRMVAATIDASNESHRRCKQTFCNFLLGCLIISFIVPWFFHGLDVL